MSDQQTTAATEKKEPQWRDICALADLAPNMGKYVEVEKHSIAVFKFVDNTVKIINDVCPHAGGSLASGYVRDGVVYCPWHGWPFSVTDGKCPDNPGICVPTYESRVVEGRVQVKV